MIYTIALCIIVLLFWGSSICHTEYIKDSEEGWELCAGVFFTLGLVFSLVTIMAILRDAGL